MRFGASYGSLEAHHKIKSLSLIGASYVGGLVCCLVAVLSSSIWLTLVVGLISGGAIVAVELGFDRVRREREYEEVRGKRL